MQAAIPHSSFTCPLGNAQGKEACPGQGDTSVATSRMGHRELTRMRLNMTRTFMFEIITQMAT